MTISRTISVVLDIFIRVLLGAFSYVWRRAILSYLRGVVIIDRTVFGDFNAGRIIWILICGFYHTIVESIVIYKEGYIHDVRYGEYIKKVLKSASSRH